MGKKKKHMKQPDDTVQQQSNSNNNNNFEAQAPWHWGQQDEEQEKVQQLTVDDGDNWRGFGKVNDAEPFDSAPCNDKLFEWAAPAETFPAANLVDRLSDGLNISNENEEQTGIEYRESDPWDIPKKKP